MKNNAVKILSAAVLLAAGVSSGATVSDILVQPRWPWDAKVDIHFVLTGADDPVNVTPTITANGQVLELAAGSVTGGEGLVNGAHTLVWDTAACGTDPLKNVSVTCTATAEPIYMLVHCTSGAVSFTNKVIGTGTQWDDAYKTDYIVLKRVRAATFKMGNTKARSSYGHECPQHDVTLTKDYYLGVYELTLAQYRNIGGSWPIKSTDDRYTANEPLRPAHCLRTATLRRDVAYEEDENSTSLLGKLSQKNGYVYIFDYPTEAQWENAAHAGHAGERYDGIAGTFSDAEWSANIDSANYLNEIARNTFNANAATTDKTCTADEGGLARVGSYEPNAWGFYDMLGNVREFCRDGYLQTAYDTLPSEDPCHVPTTTGQDLVMRGGSYTEGMNDCRPTKRLSMKPAMGYLENGARLCVTIR